MEEARVELNILHHQLDRALRRYNKSKPTTLNRKPIKNDLVLALGTSEEVPKFLRHQGKVKNRYMKKTELEVRLDSLTIVKTRLSYSNHSM